VAHKFMKHTLNILEERFHGQARLPMPATLWALPSTICHELVGVRQDAEGLTTFIQSWITNSRSRKP
jgi:hypothetical protein